MKTFPAFLISLAILLNGCATTDFKSLATPANARVAANLVCSNTLTFAVKDADRFEVASYVFAVAHMIRSLAGGTVPGPDDINRAVMLVSKNAAASKWPGLAGSMQAIYGGLWGQLKGNPKLAAQFLEAIAAGCEDAAEPHLRQAIMEAGQPRR